MSPGTSSLPPGLLGSQCCVLLLKTLTSSSEFITVSLAMYLQFSMKPLRSSAKNDFFFSFLQHTNTAHKPPLGDLFWAQCRVTPQANCQAALRSRSPPRKPSQAHGRSQKSPSPRGHWPGAAGTRARTEPQRQRPLRYLHQQRRSKGVCHRRVCLLISGMKREPLSSSLINRRGADDLHATAKGKRETAKMVPREIPLMGFSRRSISAYNIWCGGVRTRPRCSPRMERLQLSSKAFC